MKKNVAVFCGLGALVLVPAIFIFSKTILTGAFFQSKFGDTGPRVEEKILTVDGEERTYLIHLPEGSEEKGPLPLVFVLHGATANGYNAIRMSRMNTKADREKFIVVYPNGSGAVKGHLLTWNSGNCCSYARNNDIDDVAFFRKLIERLEMEYDIDPKRVYVTGFSNGGMMAYRLACELSDKIAAIAPVAAAIGTDDCRPTQPVSVIIFHGTKDKYVPYDGGAPLKLVNPDDKRTDKSVSDAVSMWTEYDGCKPLPVKKKYGNIEEEHYTECRNRTAVSVYTIKGQGHAWPGGRRGLANGNPDPPTQEISATDLIWEFFKKHPKRG